MADSIEELLDEIEIEMDGAIDYLNRALQRIRAGRATPDMVSGVRVDYYGTPTPVSQVGNISVPDSRMITITPWEKHMIPIIEKAIRDANLGFNPGSDGDMVRIPIPALNEERRKKLVKQANEEGENARISLRQTRNKANSELKKMKNDGFSEDEVKNGEKKVQDITNNFGNKVAEILKEKEKQIMTV